MLKLVAVLHTFLPTPAHAQDTFGFTEHVIDSADGAFGENWLRFFRYESFIGGIIQTVLSFLGVILLILIIYAGFLWMTAAGNTDQVAKAKQIIVRAIVGMFIVMFAYTLSSFILGVFQNG